MEDLNTFKSELLFAINQMLAGNAPKPAKKWLKSNEVRKLLEISPGTLQTLRDNGTLPFTKIGGLIFYNTDEVDKMLSKKNLRRAPSMDPPGRR